MLIQHKANVNARNVSERGGRRVPGDARAGALTARACRCDQGAGNTPLHFAFGYKYVECGDFLRANGADDSLKNEDDETCYEIFKEDQEATAER